MTQSAASRLGDLMARRNDASTIGVRIGLRRPRSFGGVMVDGSRLAMVFVACGVVVFLACMYGCISLLEVEQGKGVADSCFTDVDR